MKVLPMNTLDKVDARRMSDVQLASMGVRLFNRDDLVLQCIACGETWTPQLDSGGKLPFDYWLCPAKCNR
jgi:hypothetical protein